MMEMNVSKYDQTKKSFEQALKAFDELKTNTVIDVRASETIPVLTEDYNKFLDEFRDKSELLRSILYKFKPLKEIVQD